ncbi:hypothetical protein [Symbiobacterium thermophilum]|uniref:hypothetical protein n=1 Tax=Symbiobacterium thermophilum TaxID=2734 RepID=UPI002355CF13|nr:hypothetical protein [Symbiobacterium thermophilum]
MTWILLAAGLLLVVLGVWGGPATRRRPEKAERIPREATVQEAWDILTSPVEYDEELIKIPDHQPWFLPGGDRRFQRGLAVGLGAGLMLAVLLAPLIARPKAPASPEPGDNTGVVQGPGQQDPGGWAPDPSFPPNQPPAADPEPEPEPEPDPGNAGEPEPAPSQTVSVTVAMGSSSQDIAALLKEAGLVKSEEDFLSVVAELGVETRLKAGTFDIPTDASPIEIVNLLTQ